MKEDNINSIYLQQGIDEDAEYIPLMVEEDDDDGKKEKLPTELPILPVRNTILFPGAIIPITAGRDKSIKLLKEVNAADKLLGVVSQVDMDTENPSFKDINSIGTVAKILKIFQLPDGNTTVILQGKKKFKIVEELSETPYLKAKIETIDDKKPTDKKEEFQILIDTLKETGLKIITENPNIPTEASFALKNIESNQFLINFIAGNLNISVEEKQMLLEESDLNTRAISVLKHLQKELQLLEIKNDIQSKVKTDMDQQQREYLLHQQIRTIQEELGGVSAEGEIEDMRVKAKSKKWPEKTEEVFQKELIKLQRLNPQMAEYSVQRNYLELLLDLPWGEYSKDKIQLKKSKNILDRDHFGLEKVKERILEYLAVLKLKNDMKSPIICLSGPPGVGKTSLGKSIAESLGRKYIRISLGGVHDESEIRGHRKTYIGSMPGRIIQGLKKAGTSNPVIVLDEIDKLGTGTHGDPSSALLEVLDPEQNGAFHDNFLEVEYDLSKVLFIATANVLSTIQPALRDRLEIIQLSGYTQEEKVQIAKKYLLPKQLEGHGLGKNEIKINKESLAYIEGSYTRESGVRGLEKQISKIVRQVAKRKVMKEKYNKNIDKDFIIDCLGVPYEKSKYHKNDVAGVVTGLAWTSVGGEILFIESVLSKGKGNLSITGNLGKVMKESATLALEYIKSNYKELGVNPEVFANYDVHIHVPEGATPKDGPSAGITMLTSLVSSFTQRKVKDYIAMTGEITLRGKVLPVGGIKEKILAAKRADIKEIILCEANKKDVEDIEERYVKGLTFHYVSDMKQLINLALDTQLAKKAKKLV